MLTAVLVAVTGYYAKLTRDISASTDRSAKAAERAAHLATRSVEAAERAILADVMPVLITEWVSTGSTRGRNFQVKNVGRTTALNIVLRHDDKEHKVAAIAPGGYEPAIRGVKTEMTSEGHTVVEGPATLEYEDAIGNQYQTVCSLVALPDRPMYRTSRRMIGGWVPLTAGDEGPAPSSVAP